LNLTEQAAAKACCADLYQSDLARLVFGDTLHPGGLGLTNRLGRLMELHPDDWVADLASGRGSSALAVSRVFHCNVLGVEFGEAAVVQARDSALESDASQTYFVRGDAEYIPLRPGRFDAVFSECSISLFADKPAAVRQIADLLRPGGRFGLSDVALATGSLPSELDGTLGQLLCMTDALDVDGYQELLQDSGLELVHSEDASPEIIKILDDVESKIGALKAWQSLAQPAEGQDDMLGKVPSLITSLRRMVEEGELGYWLFVGQKPG
jgi:arsenite methyltransferase